MEINLKDKSGNPNSDDLLKMMKAHAHQLYEHFDTVQVFCTKHGESNNIGTLRFQHGEGNFFARYGQVKDFIIREDEFSKIQSRNDEG